MRVGLLTSWRTQCGIAEYSTHLARALTRAGAEVVVLGSRNDESQGRHLPPPEGVVALQELPIFDVQAWRADGRHGFEVDAVLAQELDVLHVQYEVILYHEQLLRMLLARFPGVRAVTWHDNCIPPSVPMDWHVMFRHRADTGPGGVVIPFGVEALPPVVRTFGLGRSEAGIIGDICHRHGWRFEASFGTREWKTQRELHDWLREADVIVLWYPPNAGAGSSQAARTALATRRRVIVNDVQWFADLPGTGGGLLKLEDDPRLLEGALEHMLTTPWVSWDEVAALHLAAYQREAAHEAPLATA